MENKSLDKHDLYTPTFDSFFQLSVIVIMIIYGRKSFQIKERKGEMLMY
jgi:hypothetical protein